MRTIRSQCLRLPSTRRSIPLQLARGMETTSKSGNVPSGHFVFNFGGHNAIINTLSVNSEGVLFSGSDSNGSMMFWDYATGTPFQNMEDIPQPGSLEAEAGIFCSTFNMMGTRLIKIQGVR